MSIFISCGEPSGDHYAAILVRELVKAGYHDEIWGMAGSEAEKEGCFAVKNMNELCLMGFSEVIPAIPRLFRLKNSISRMIIERQPETVVVVDSPDFHIPLLRSLKKKGFGGRIVYLVPPTVWVWREGRTRSLSRLCDLCLPLFGFEHEFLLKKGVPSMWKGHPVLEEMKNYSAPADILPFETDREIISILPGSRRSEINRMLPHFISSADLIEEMGFCPVFSIAPGLPEDVKRDMRSRLASKKYFEGSGKDLMACSKAVLASSGTVSVEAMMLDRFMVVGYRGSWISYLLYRLFINVPFFSLPNIMSGTQIYPELLQDHANAEEMTDCLKRYFQDIGYQKKIHFLLSETRNGMGNDGAGAFWASKILEISGQ